MEQIKILFFSLLSFFGIENSRIAANKTTVTIDPVKKSIEIIQADLFAFIEQDADKEAVIQQWNDFTNTNAENVNWSKELEPLTNKSLKLVVVNGSIQPHIRLFYLDEKDLRPMGIWYDEENKVFSLNNISRENFKTDDGRLEGNYWKFDATQPISFSMQPFTNIPERYLKFKQPIEAVIKKDKD